MTYESTVLADSPSFLWMMQETSGTTAVDATGNDNTGTYTGGFTLGQPGPSGVGAYAVTFDGSTGFAYSNNEVTSPDVYTSEIWFQTSSSLTGGIDGFSGAQGSSGNQDRETYINGTVSGAVSSYVYSGAETIITADVTSDDGEWHYCAVTLDSGGDFILYIDGINVASATGITAAANYPGYWLAGATGIPYYLNGSACAFAVYSYALSGEQVAVHYAASKPAASQYGNIFVLTGQGM